MWIYAAWSVKTRRVYVGQTGATKSLKKVVTRFLPHWRGAKSWQTLFGRNGVRGLGKLYPIMAKMGMEWFGVLPIERLPRASMADGREIFWFKKLCPVLNVKDTMRTDTKWKLLLQGKLVRPRYTKAHVAAMIQRLGDRMRSPLPPHEQLHTLTMAKKYCSGPVRNKCYQKVALRLKNALGLSLPNQVNLRIPCMHNLERFGLQKTLTSHLDKLPLPLYLRKYLVSVNKTVFVRNPTLADLINGHPPADTLQEMRAIVHEGKCACAQLSKRWGIPSVDGHLFVRHTDILRSLFGKYARVLTQNARNDVHQAWKSVKRTVMQSLRQLFIAVLPEKQGERVVRQCYTDTLSAAKMGWGENKKLTPWFLWEKTVRDMAEQFGPDWKFEIVDKNGGQLSAHCWVGAMKGMLKNLVGEFPSAVEAQVQAMTILKEHAHAHNLKKYWSQGKKKGPPTTRFLGKNKFDELIGWGYPPAQFLLHRTPGDVWHQRIVPYATDQPRQLFALLTANSHILGMFMTDFLDRTMSRWMPCTGDRESSSGPWAPSFIQHCNCPLSYIPACASTHPRCCHPLRPNPLPHALFFPTTAILCEPEGE